MKTFVVIVDEVNDCVSEHNITVCKTREIAQRVFNEKVDEAKKRIADYFGWEQEETPDWFEAYEDGYYAHNHFCVSIEETEIVEE